MSTRRCWPPDSVAMVAAGPVGQADGVDGIGHGGPVGGGAERPERRRRAPRRPEATTSCTVDGTAPATVWRWGT